MFAQKSKEHITKKRKMSIALIHTFNRNQSKYLRRFFSFSTISNGEVKDKCKGEGEREEEQRSEVDSSEI
jgi:hypothetical protein